MLIPGEPIRLGDKQLQEARDEIKANRIIAKQEDREYMQKVKDMKIEDKMKMQYERDKAKYVKSISTSHDAKMGFEL